MDYERLFYQVLAICYIAVAGPLVAALPALVMWVLLALLVTLWPLWLALLVVLWPLWLARSIEETRCAS
jgi:hypothetical protein